MKQQRVKLREDGLQTALDFYAQPGAMSGTGRHAQALGKLPNDVAALAEIIQGLAIHQYMAEAYGFKVPEARKAESHIRHAEKILDHIIALDDRPLSTARPPEKRVVGVCHHFALLMTVMMRAKGIPARYRCGFGAFFNPPYFEDHVLCEYWNTAEARWIQVDPQLDAVWRDGLKFKFDPLDVPRDQFLQASDAWSLCRSGKADPKKFGIFVGDLRGLWFIAASLIRDVAALNKMEMLPWDCWGIMPRPGQELDAGQLAFFDRLAALTATPDSSLGELRALNEDERMRVPTTVFNAVLNRPEAVDR
ncbi:MAG TPA: transglutaminase-like domain-containing protein [Dongiaceae bacterium]|nr:transglutaminase-like domain-containing protein [Dongiaceae bacterium]